LHFVEIHTVFMRKLGVFEINILTKEVGRKRMLYGMTNFSLVTASPLLEVCASVLEKAEAWQLF